MYSMFYNKFRKFLNRNIVLNLTINPIIRISAHPDHAHHTFIQINRVLLHCEITYRNSKKIPTTLLYKKNN